MSFVELPQEGGVLLPFERKVNMLPNQLKHSKTGAYFCSEPATEEGFGLYTKNSEFYPELMGFLLLRFETNG